MKVLVAGGTGMVGSFVVPELQARGAKVSVLTRNPEKVNAQFKGVAALVGDFLNPFELLTSMRGFDALFLLIPCVTSETHEGLTAVALAKEVSIKRMVYMSVHQTAYAPTWVPHIGSKVLIEAVIEKSGIPYTFLRPNVFMQNDRWFQQAIVEHRVYPQPLGKYGVSMCDVRDIAESAALTLTDDKYAGQRFTIGGPDVLTGESAALQWSAALQTPIQYGGHDMDRWATDQLTYGTPAWFAYDLKQMYQAWQTEGLIATPAELDRLSSLLGHVPRSYASFVSEQCDAWAAKA